MGVAILPTYNSNVTLYEDEQHVCYIDNITVNPVPTGINNQNTEKLMINYSNGQLIICGTENGPARITVYDTNGCAVTTSEVTVIAKRSVNYETHTNLFDTNRTAVYQ